MKTTAKTFFLPLAVVFTAFLFSCESEETDIQENSIESTNISDLIVSADKLEFDIETSQRFRYDLNLAEGEEATIVSGAENAIVDKINANGKYVYLSDADFTGTEGILIRIEAEPTEEQEGLILIFGNVRYVYITLNVGESLDDQIESAEKIEINLTAGTTQIIPIAWNNQEEATIVSGPEHAGPLTLFSTYDRTYAYQSENDFVGTENILIEITGELATRYVYITINVEELPYEDLIESAYKREHTVTSGTETFIPFGWGDESYPEIAIAPENGQTGEFTFTTSGMGFNYQSDPNFTGTVNILIRETDTFWLQENGQYREIYFYYTINVEAPLVGVIFN